MLLNLTTFFVKERVGFAKLTDTYDIFDPQTQQRVGVAKDEPATWAKWLRLVVSKQLLPTRLNVYEQEAAPPVLSVAKPPAIFRSKVIVTAGDGRPLGHFKSKIFSLGGGFFVFDAGDRQLAEIKGDWKGWNFRMLGSDGREIGTVSKKWAGVGKELFTSADNYVISLTGGTTGSTDTAALLLAAGLAIDVVFKEKQ